VVEASEQVEQRDGETAVTNNDLLAGAPPLRGTRVELSVIEPQDMEFLYKISTAEENLFRWRYRGSPIDRQEFASTFSAGVLAQFLVRKRHSKRPIGLVTAYNANHRDGYVYLSTLTSPELVGSGLTVDGTILMANFLFAGWTFRKIYFESLEFNTLAFHSAFQRFLVEEGRLREHAYYGGRYWDQVTLGLYRERWTSSFSQHELGFSSFGEARLMTVVESETPLMSIDEFCKCLTAAVPPTNSAPDVSPDSKLVLELGYDSFALTELVTVIDELTRSDSLEWPDQFETMRDLYLWYTTLASAP
jgi:RimJ/RimL family protein N-acetyltransferase/acyl carrier protein